jgi:glucosamine 6-phosphate synthetase-like amidotransferase/phosphosugar isomerase protein
VIDYGKAPYFKVEVYQAVLKNLLKESQIRGRDASGLCVVTTKKISIFKARLSGEELAKSEHVGTLMKRMHNGQFRSAIGHTRAQTKGSEWFNANNHPIIAGNIIGVHNGMIGNDELLFNEFEGKINRAGMVDSEIIFRLIDYYRREGEGRSLIQSVKLTCEKIVGTYRCAFVDRCNSRYVTLFHNDNYNPSIALYDYTNAKVMVFASSEWIVDRSVTDRLLPYPLFDGAPVKKYDVREGGVRIDTDTGEMCFFRPKPEKKTTGQSETSSAWLGGYGRCSMGDCDKCAHLDFCCM